MPKIRIWKHFLEDVLPWLNLSMQTNKITDVWVKADRLMFNIANEGHSVIRCTYERILVHFQTELNVRFLSRITKFTNTLDSQVAQCGIIMMNRKSTRLNSSHVASSYAVFCLK